MARPKPVLVIATTNRGKAAEIGNGLRGVPVRVTSLADLGVRTVYPETGSTFAANARGKSLFYSRATNDLTLAEDSGIEIEALDGAPGVRSARFSGRGATDGKNIRKVLAMMAGVPPGSRKARFVSTMVLSRRGRVLATARGIVRGTIGPEPKGRFGFGYDPIFRYAPFRKTFAEIAPRTKNTVSHRGQAVRKIRVFLLDYLKRGGGA